MVCLWSEDTDFISQSVVESVFAESEIFANDSYVLGLSLTKLYV